MGKIQYARLDDLDRPLHRIFPIWLFEETIRLKRLTLVKPTKWPDPREDPCKDFHLVSRSKPTAMRALSAYLAPAWAQCWSYEAKSDTLLRAYSRVLLDPISKRNTDPANEGVRVTTTARKLIGMMEGWADRFPDHMWFLGRVIYQDEEGFGQQLANHLSSADGPNAFTSPEIRADSLLYKRAFFRHEDEVRMLCIGPGRLWEGDDLKHMPIDPNELFDEVCFDPRLILFEQRERQKQLADIGFSGRFVEGQSYAGALVRVMIQGDLPEPPEQEQTASIDAA